MINSPSFYSDPDVLPSLSPSSRKDIGDCGITYNTQGTKVGYSGLTRMRPKDGVLLMQMGVLSEGFCLLAVDNSQPSIDALPYRISSRPISSKGKGRKKQQDWQVSHNTRSLSGNTRIVK